MTEWQGGAPSFQRSGGTGTLALQDNCAQPGATLGFPPKEFAPQI